TRKSSEVDSDTSRRLRGAGLAAWPFFVAVAIAYRLSALLNEVSPGKREELGSLDAPTTYRIPSCGLGISVLLILAVGGRARRCCLHASPKVVSAASPGWRR